MAETEGRNSGKGNNQRRQSSRLQRRAPGSIQVNPATSFASGWKVAIPLLSPLAMSPTSPPTFGERTAEISSSREESRQVITSSQSQSQSQSQTTEKPSFKTWQHPAAPFYEPAKPAKFLSALVSSSL